MKVKHKRNEDVTGFSSSLNTHGLGEMIVVFNDGEMSSDLIKDYDVQLRNGEWVDLSQAFIDHVVITDNRSHHFREAKTDEERERGYYI